MYLKACQNGLPFILKYAASQGMSQSDVDSMSFLENDVLGLSDMFRPLKTSSTLGKDDTNPPSEGKGATDEGGAPAKELGDLTDSGEKNRENGDG